jgi:MFS family permease
MTFRAVLTASTLADPFLIVYARRELNLPMFYLGTYLVAAVAARILSSPFWSWLETRGGHRAVLQASALARLIAPLIALVVPYVADTPLYRNHFDDNRPLFYAFALVFTALGAALGGQIRANFGYLMDIAPAELRPAYTSLANAIMAIAALAPLVGAKLIERYSYETLFTTASLVGLAAIFVSGILTDTHTRIRPVAQTWRLRGVRS